jgi:6-pyruvoyl-tetrahydropterin synthase
MNSWLDDKLQKHRLDEKPKESSSTGSVHKFVVKVSIGGTLMQTAVFAENVSRAKKIANKMFGASNVKTIPVKK